MMKRRKLLMVLYVHCAQLPESRKIPGFRIPCLFLHLSSRLILSRKFYRINNTSSEIFINNYLCRLQYNTRVYLLCLSFGISLIKVIITFPLMMIKIALLAKYLHFD